MTYENPKESPDEYHPIYNTVVQWLDGDATPPTLTANAPKARQFDRAARNQAGKQRPTKRAAPAE